MTADEDRGDFLRRLAGADFCPPEEWVVAVNNRAGTTAVVSSDAEAGDAAEVRFMVDEFAQGFWQRRPDDRWLKWESLARRQTDAPTRAFLIHLRRGLSHLPIVTRDRAMNAVAATVRELFTLRPRPRAVRRTEWLDTRDRDVDWRAVVDRLRTVDPVAVVLDPSLVGYLDELSPTPTAVRAVPPRERRTERRRPPEVIRSWHERAINWVMARWWQWGLSSLLLISVLSLVMMIVYSGRKGNEPKVPSTYRATTPARPTVPNTIPTIP